MTSSNPDLSSNDVVQTEAKPSQLPRPRWVRIFGAIVFVLILLFVAMMIVGGGQHGPGRHMGADTAERSTVSTMTSAPFMGGFHR